MVLTLQTLPIRAILGVRRCAYARWKADIVTFYRKKTDFFLSWRKTFEKKSDFFWKPYEGASEELLPGFLARERQIRRLQNRVKVMLGGGRGKWRGGPPSTLSLIFMIFGLKWDPPPPSH